MTNANYRPRAKAISQSDIIVVILAQEISDADKRIRSAAAPSPERSQAIIERNALVNAKSRVDRYLAGDTSVLVR